MKSPVYKNVYIKAAELNEIHVYVIHSFLYSSLLLTKSIMFHCSFVFQAGVICER